YLGEVQEKNIGRPKNESRKLGRAADARVMRPVDLEEIRLRRAELNQGVPVPLPPFWGPQTIARVPAKAIVPYLNERMLYQFQWGYRKEGRTLAEYKAWAKKELRPVLARICDIAIRENILVPQAAREWFADNRYQDYLYLHGLSVEMAEAFAEYVHKRIRGELGFAAEEARDHDEMLNQGYRGSRYSFGYPACPNLADQRLILELLRADEIGVALTDEDQ